MQEFDCRTLLGIQGVGIGIDTDDNPIEVLLETYLSECVQNYFTNTETLSLEAYCAELEIPNAVLVASKNVLATVLAKVKEKL